MCPACKETLKICAFGKNKAKPDGLQNYCKNCRSKKVSKKDKEKLADYQKLYRSKNSQHLSEKSKEKYKNNSAPAKERAAKWRANNPQRKKSP